MAFGGTLAVAAAAPAFFRGRSEFAFEEVPGLPGFRRLNAGSLSGGLNPLAGLDEVERSREVRPDLSLCRDLWTAELAEGRVPVASFSDYNCPYCRVLTPELGALEAEGEITVSWHELPLLGETSRLAARAALAADAQGQYLAFHNRLMRTRFVPNEAYVFELAVSTSLDLHRFKVDYASPDIDARIAASLSLAEVLGLPGTPSLVVGRTIVIGAIPVPVLKRLIALEASDRVDPC